MQIDKGTIYARAGEDCLAIDRATLEVKWCVPGAAAAAVGDGMLFVNAEGRAGQPARMGETTLYAVALEGK